MRNGLTEGLQASLISRYKNDEKIVKKKLIKMKNYARFYLSKAYSRRRSLISSLFFVFGIFITGGS